MNQPKPQLPLWPTPPPAVQRSAVVGGFPWAQPSAEPASPFVVIDSTKTSGKRSGVDGHGENLAPLPLWSAVRARLKSLVRKSPAWTVSLSLHVLLLLLLMFGVVQQKKQEGLRLDMSFSLAQDDQGMEKGIKIEAPPEPEPMTTQDEEKKEEVPEVAATELPPVEQPLATPSVAPPVEDGQAATSTTASLAIGSALMGREPGQKKMLLQAFGGGASTEAAVAMALDWLSRQQQGRSLELAGAVCRWWLARKQAGRQCDELACISRSWQHGARWAVSQCCGAWLESLAWQAAARGVF